MKTKWKLIFSSIAGVIILGFTLYNLTGGLEAELLEIQPQTIANTFREEGTVIPHIEQPIYALGSQEIIELSVKEGQVVQKGDVLAVLDTRELDFQLKQLQAQLASTQGEQSKTFSEQYETLAKSHQLQIKQAELELAALETNFKRLEELYNAGAVTRKELEDAQKAWEMARINLEKEKEALRLLEESYSASGGTTQYYAGRLEAIRAQIESLKYKIEKSTIRAPISGVVANLTVKKGELVQTGIPLMTVFDPDSYQVEVFILAQDISEIEKGMEVKLIDNRKNETIAFEGIVREISPAAIEKVSALGLLEQRVKVIIDFSLTPDRIKLFPGYKLDVEFTTAKRENELVVPKTVLFADKEGYSLWVVKGGKARIQPVEKGFENDQYIVIEKGLEQGDLVILDPQLAGLAEGKKIKGKSKD